MLKSGDLRKDDTGFWNFIRIWLPAWKIMAPVTNLLIFDLQINILYWSRFCVPGDFASAWDR